MLSEQLLCWYVDFHAFILVALIENFAPIYLLGTAAKHTPTAFVEDVEDVHQLACLIKDCILRYILAGMWSLNVCFYKRKALVIPFPLKMIKIFLLKLFLIVRCECTEIGFFI